MQLKSHTFNVKIINCSNRYFIPEMYHEQADLNGRLKEKRLEGQFLPGAINALESHDQEDCSGFLPPRIIYVGQALPEPFVEPREQRRGRVFGLSNFLIKGRPPMEPRSFEVEGELPPATTERSNATAAGRWCSRRTRTKTVFGVDKGRGWNYAIRSGMRRLFSHPVVANENTGVATFLTIWPDWALMEDLEAAPNDCSASFDNMPCERIQSI